MGTPDLQLDTVPAVQNQDVRVLFSGLNIEDLGRADSLEAAWAFLPARGTGVVTHADRVTRFDPEARTGLLIEADVCNGRATTVVRADGSGWHAWRWTETDGDTHVVVDRTYLSSESINAPGLAYRQYWTKINRHFEPDSGDGVPVWTPVCARFCGFEEARA